MPKRLIVPSVGLVVLALFQLKTGTSWVTFRPALGAAALGYGLGLMSSAYGIYAKKTAVRFFLPTVFLVFAGVIAFEVGTMLSVYHEDSAAVLFRIVAFTCFPVSLTIISVLAFRSRRAQDYCFPATRS